jgi:hypothetical protein
LKLLLDEMWSSEVARQLRRRGFDVAAVLDRPDLKSKPDEFLLAAAGAESRAIVTENLKDFRRLAMEASRAGRQHAGVIYTIDSRFHRADARTIGRLVRALERLLLADPPQDGLEHWLERAD